MPSDIGFCCMVSSTCNFHKALCVLCYRFRIICHKICNHPYFGNVVLACIIISSGMLAAEDPLDVDKNRNNVGFLISLKIISDFSYDNVSRMLGTDLTRKLFLYLVRLFDDLQKLETKQKILPKIL